MFMSKLLDLLKKLRKTETTTQVVKLSDMTHDGQGNQVVLVPGPLIQWSVNDTNVATVKQNEDGSEATLTAHSSGATSVWVTDGTTTATETLSIEDEEPRDVVKDEVRKKFRK
jgi:FtsP/CotA-like multicopper oxidase with cupredoxin domain